MLEPDHPGLCVRTWASLAGEGQVVVAGDIIPLAVLMPYHHNTVLSRVEVVVRLVRPPVLILLWRDQVVGSHDRMKKWSVIAQVTCILRV